VPFESLPSFFLMGTLRAIFASCDAVSCTYIPQKGGPTCADKTGTEGRKEDGLWSLKAPPGYGMGLRGRRVTTGMEGG
jgi:hypothetical protein